MNYAIIRKLLGKIMILVGILMILPIIVGLIYRESFMNILSFVIPLTVLILAGILLSFKKADSKMQAKEGFIIVGLSWIIMSLVGSLPLLISGYYTNFFDAFFEITSGFTTTGATVTSSELLQEMMETAHSILFWRSFSHWIGGMGILVFILAIIPESNEGSAVHILRAESPGPTVGRLVSKMRASSRILYLIYIGLTIAQIIFLMVGPHHEMDLFQSLIYTFGTAGTGGFGVSPISVEAYSSYYQYVIGIFMIIFGINFTIYYLVLTRNFKEIFKNEEIRWYLVIIVLSIITIMINILRITSSIEEAFRLSFFQVSSIISTTGFSTTNYATWPALSQGVLIVLMFFGSCAGSTAGGMKISRIVILVKSALNKIKNMVNPRKVTSVKVNGKVVDDSTIAGVQSFSIVYILVFIVCAFIVSFDGFDLVTNFTTSLACISNVGPGLSMVGPYGSYNSFSNLSKLVLSMEMIAGRLELFPILILFSPTSWFNKL